MNPLETNTTKELKNGDKWTFGARHILIFAIIGEDVILARGGGHEVFVGIHPV